MDSVKRPGCCSHCGTEIHEVVTRYPDGPLHRFPRQLGPPLLTLRQVHYVLRDGSRAHISVCESCVSVVSDPANMPSVWHKVIDTFVFEERDDVRAAMPSALRTTEQKQANQAGILALMKNPPLGVIATLNPNA